MSRANISLDDRRPFYLYVDEFQNFATESFAVILSEARKYGLYLTVANQYVAQMMDEVRDAVFGNVGSMITFRVGADDAAALARYFEPVFEPTDLTNQSVQNIYVTMSIDGDTSQPFSGKTLRLPKPTNDFTREIRQYSRDTYNIPRDQVEKVIAEWQGFKDEPVSTNQNPAVVAEPRTANGTQLTNQLPTRPQLQVANAEPKNYSELVKASHSQPSRSSSSQSRQGSGQHSNQNSQNRSGGQPNHSGQSSQNRSRNRGPRKPR